MDSPLQQRSDNESTCTTLLQWEKQTVALGTPVEQAWQPRANARHHGCPVDQGAGIEGALQGGDLPYAIDGNPGSAGAAERDLRKTP